MVQPLVRGTAAGSDAIQQRKQQTQPAAQHQQQHAGCHHQTSAARNRFIRVFGILAR